MNAKQSKRLRRGAHALTVGQPWRLYQRTNPQGTVALQPGCGRKLYQQAKAAFRRYGADA